MVEALLEVAALVAEQPLELVEQLTDQFVGLPDGPAGLVDEVALQGVPA